jgi:hypothetical protein
VVLKTSSTLAYGGKKGISIPVDLSRSPAREIAERVNWLNDFFAGVVIDPDDAHYGFQRIYNQADKADFAWNKGGRLYSMGDSYQHMKAAERQLIRINGEAVAEIDIRASHLTILHGKSGWNFDPGASDPYTIEGLPRWVVKAWVTMTLGHDRFHKRWSKENSGKYRELYGIELQIAYPIAEVRERVIKALPALGNWARLPIRWGDLQYIESCAVTDAVYELAFVYGIPALPVHDSIIVQTKSQGYAKNVLSACFKRHVGLWPTLCLK